MQKMRSNSVVSRLAGWGMAAVMIASTLNGEAAAAADLRPQAGAAVGSPSTPRQLHVVILDGEGALNNIKERTAREPIVQIQDENHKPVSEAAVIFLIQGNGGSTAGGTFANGLTSFTTTTGADGVAKAPGLSPNGVAGSFTIVVTATVAGITATSLIHQTNAPGGGSQLGKVIRQQQLAHPHLVVIGGVVAGAAVVATVVAVTTLNSTSPTSIITGGTTVGAPTSTLTLHFGRRH